MEKSGEIDSLAAIAARGAIGSEALAEQWPVPLPDLRLPPMTAGADQAFVPPTPPTAEGLAEELDGLRKRMEHFLLELAPEQPSTRRCQALAAAEWRLEPQTNWQQVRLPHYGGPIGRARAWYRATVTLEEQDFAVGSIWVCFGGVDYRAAAFWNGQLVGSHEGFFSPFEFEVTSAAHLGTNELLVRVDNDAIFHSNQTWADPRAGDKLYAATGLGWDEPGSGWHHCPPGMGIHRPVKVECRPRVFLGNLFVRPLPQDGCVEAWVEVHQTGEHATPLELQLAIHGRNFLEAGPVSTAVDSPPASTGINRYRFRLPMENFRWWSPVEPWLYRLNVTLRADGQTDTSSISFGMRSFVLDESPGPDGQRGRFLLNDRIIRLRGANTMGHEQQCVLRGDLDQLRDDILLAKLCHINFLRFTQRPVEPEVYDLCDRLGMMAQTDLPLFGHLRRNCFAEAVRQTVEMERLVRSHPSNVLVSFINEPFPAAWGDQSHRHLTRTELESFFSAATAALRVENPDRQVKPIDGDYEPPGPGLPDGHCYSGWYNGHGLDLGRLHKGFWFEVKPGWNYACGEFGSEGLDPENLMREMYPPDWLPGHENEEAQWTPARIAKCQTGTHYRLWLESSRSMAEWIRRSQAHQAWVTKLMTEAFRRNNKMVSFAIHLFIDAWPAGWMKAIMDCRRQPKPAYFAYRNALSPAAAFLRMDRAAFFSGEPMEAEAWVCLDGDVPLGAGAQVVYQIEAKGTALLSGRTRVVSRPGEAVFQGRIVAEAPLVTHRETLELRLGLLDAAGQLLHSSAETLTVFPPLGRTSRGGAMAMEGARAAELAAELPEGFIVTEDPADWPSLAEQVQAGATLFLSECPAGEFELAGSILRFEACGMEPRHFVARAPGHPLARRFEENDFRFWFDAAVDRPSPLLYTLFFADESWQPILITGQGGWGMEWTPALAAAEKPFGLGRVIVCQLTLAGRLDNPVARQFLQGLGVK